MIQRTSSKPQLAEVKLSVIIVSYRNYEVLSDCLNSIDRFNDIGTALEVIVVEQSPEDGIYQELQAKFPWVRVIRHENRGFGAGNNAGAHIAQGRYLLFLNPDTVLVEPVFSFSLGKFEADQTLGLFGVRLIDKEGSRNQSFYFRKPYGILRGSVLYRICDRFDIFMSKSMYITGADMFVRAKAFSKVGGFDERMFMYFEETYLCERLNDVGMSVRYFPERRIVHLEGKTSGGVNMLARQIESLKYLCEETGWSFRHILKKMRRDRLVKTFLGSDRSEQIALIDKALKCYEEQE